MIRVISRASSLFFRIRDNAGFVNEPENGLTIDFSFYLCVDQEIAG